MIEFNSTLLPNGCFAEKKAGSTSVRNNQGKNKSGKRKQSGKKRSGTISVKIQAEKSENGEK